MKKFQVQITDFQKLINKNAIKMHGRVIFKDLRVVFFGGVFRFWWGVFGLQLSGSTETKQLSDKNIK